MVLIAPGLLTNAAQVHFCGSESSNVKTTSAWCLTRELREKCLFKSVSSFQSFATFRLHFMENLHQFRQSGGIHPHAHNGLAFPAVP